MFGCVVKQRLDVIALSSLTKKLEPSLDEESGVGIETVKKKKDVNLNVNFYFSIKTHNKRIRLASRALQCVTLLAQATEPARRRGGDKSNVLDEDDDDEDVRVLFSFCKKIS